MNSSSPVLIKNFTPSRFARPLGWANRAKQEKEPLALDLATLIGGVTAFGLVFGSIAMGGGMAFLDAASAMIVLGGTFGAMLLATSLDKFKSIMAVTGKAFKQPSYDLGTSAASMVEYAQIARREGILGLEKAISSADPF